MKGVILAAGYATRFLPASKTIPNEMFPLFDPQTKMCDRAKIL